VKATTALRPMPDASAMGMFAKRPMAMDMTPAPSAVTAAVWVLSSPTAPRMTGFTKMM
jgi:hypothetical protein